MIHHPDHCNDFIASDAALSQLFVAQPVFSPQDINYVSLELLDQNEIPLQVQRSPLISRANSTESSSFSSPPTDIGSASSTAGEPSSSRPFAASQNSPFIHDGQARQPPRQALFWCVQCPNRAPFRMQSQLTSHERTHSKPYACRMHKNCAFAVLNNGIDCGTKQDMEYEHKA
ncbi:hypothetical protein B0O99DRAFT_302349 [Bisporella sp. PMI_857]|nr:hypothetical protein B0O99DRAFT_302349 [Bisporella sp. PMI_857]